MAAAPPNAAPPAKPSLADVILYAHQCFATMWPGLRILVVVDFERSQVDVRPIRPRWLSAHKIVAIYRDAVTLGAELTAFLESLAPPPAPTPAAPATCLEVPSHSYDSIEILPAAPAAPPASGPPPVVQLIARVGAELMGAFNALHPGVALALAVRPDGSPDVRIQPLRPLSPVDLLDVAEDAERFGGMYARLIARVARS